MKLAIAKMQLFPQYRLWETEPIPFEVKKGVFQGDTLSPVICDLHLILS